MTATDSLRPAAIEAEHIGFTYPGESVPALQDVSLSVAAGSCFGLLGPNGAGKTTLLSILTGILPLQTGQARIHGQPLADGRTLREQSALVPQEYAFYNALTGRENLECFAGLYGLTGTLKQQRIDFAVGVCGLGSLLGKRAASCSGGVKRRLNLAIGLLNQPRILYLDEPTVGIDAQSRHFILESIAQLRREGMTIVYTSHYMEEIQAVCDALAVIDHGRVLLADSVANLLDRDAGRLAVVTLDAAPDAAQLARLSVLGAIEAQGAQLRIRLGSEAGQVERLAHALAGAGLGIRQLQYGVSRLEDIYLSATRPELRD